jgi:hypothetical protein
MDSGKMPLGFPIQQSERTLTAARPPRTLTAFPFDYPEATASGPAVKIYHFQRATLPDFYQAVLQSSSKK